MTQAAQQPAAVQRQITLPLSKAVEIAWKSIRLRLSRSLLVTSGIVLALAFLVSIQASEAVVRGMRDWVKQAPGMPWYAQLSQRRESMEEEVTELAASIAEATRGAAAPKPDQPKFDPKKQFGDDFGDMQKLAGSLPAGEAELTNALTARPELVPLMQKWFNFACELEVIRHELTGPQRLDAEMRANGVPTKPEEIESNRIQTRWLLGLALLVAFVGILNAMLMSVTERFREIGTMKCLGALDGFIVKLFLIESLFQGIVGTVIGIAVGLGLSLAAAATTYGGYAFRNLPCGQILTAIAISLAVGVGLTVAGAVYPAWQAARMQPIEAMRVET
jgi:hypothetical protein